MHPLKDNPFHVLELPPSCTAMDVERQGKKLLGMLEVGLAAAATYPTPLGAFPRTPERVREAMALLRDPARRRVYEVWAAAPSAPPSSPSTPPWPDAFAPLWWAQAAPR